MKKRHVTHTLFSLSLGLGAVVGLVLMLAIATQPVYAATFTVSKTADTADGTCDADCSLREAIIAANTNGAGADTIIIPAGTYQLSIAGRDEFEAATGDLNIRSNLTIDGAGSGSTIIDGGGIDRVFQILDGRTVTIQDVTIQNGVAITRTGGGIYNSGTLNVNNSRIFSNTASHGGGIYHAGPEEYHDFSTEAASFIDISGTGTDITALTAEYISGSAPSTPLTAAVSIGFTFDFYGNDYTSIYVSEDGCLSFDRQNECGNGNEAIPFSGNPTNGMLPLHDPNMTPGTIYAETQGSSPNRQFIVQYDAMNLAGGNATFQVILFESNNDILFQYNDVETNATTQGGDATVGVKGIDGFSGIEYSFDQAVLTDGLAIRFSQVDGGTLTLNSSSTVISNAATTDFDGDSIGGGILSQGTAVINGATIQDNKSGGSGSGIHSRYGTLTVQSNALIDANVGLDSGDGGPGGGIMNWVGTATIRDSTVSNNVSRFSNGGGGGLANFIGTMTLNNVMVSSNVITDGESMGGGIFNINGILTINNSDISNNIHGEYSDGGGGLASLHAPYMLSIDQKPVVSINNSTINNNLAGGNGGGVHFQGTEATISNSTIEGNTTDQAGSGAGLALRNSYVVITNTQIINNIAGGGVLPAGTGPYENNGGGLFVYGNATVLIENSTISGNSIADPENAPGGGIFVLHSTLNITNSTIANNSTSNLNDTRGGGIRALQSKLQIRKSTISGNYAQDSGGGLSVKMEPTYVVQSSEDPDSPVSYSFEDISGTANLGLGDDDVAVQNIGFTFEFFGVNYTQLEVTSNGALAFTIGDGGNTTVVSGCDTGSDPNNVIFGFHDDLDPSAGGSVHAARRGSAPNRRFIAQYENVPISGLSETVTFQIVLFEGSNEFVVRYQDVEQSDSLNDEDGRTQGSDAVIGAESAGGSSYPSCYQTDEPSLKNNSAILFTSTSVDLENVTFSGNTAAEATGGGLDVEEGDGFTGLAGLVQLVNVTIAENDAPSGGGIHVATNSSTTEMTNTLLASNVGNNCLITNTLTSRGFNLADDGSCELTAEGDLPNTDPQLGDLMNNGGDTETYALPDFGSPAKDAGTDTGCPATDQRGVTRFLCDIGAYEAFNAIVAVGGVSEFIELPAESTSAASLTGSPIRDWGLAGLLGAVGLLLAVIWLRRRR